MDIQKRFNSLKMVLSGIAGAIIVLLSVALIIISYNAAYSSVENAYLNQLKNINDDVARQLEQFYEREQKNAVFLSRQRAMTELFTLGTPEKLAAAMARVKEIHDIYGTYENVLISTAEKNPRIVAASLPQSVGVRWGGIGYDDVIENVLKGNPFIGTPQKSPITGLAVIFVGAPIKDGDKVVGIMGLPVNLGIFMHRMVKDLRIGETGYPFATDLNGITFAHPDKEQIFKLNVKEYDWGKKMLESPSGTVVRYVWQGKDKILTFVKNEKLRFISSATMYVSDINKDAREMAVVMVVFGILGIIAAGTVIYIFIARRLKPLEACKDVMKEMASGNLAVRYEGIMSKDEIGDIARSLNGTMDQFEKLISEVMTASQNLVQAVEQIATGNQNLSQRTSEQASSLEEIASTIEEATAAIKQNADNSGEANKLAGVTTKMAEEGNSVVMNAVTSINEINKSSKKIEEIISLINEVSFQTNLLALNAAVEAARAGEQGRGFAVVAGEVRNLAQRSANAAKEIGSLIKDSIEKIGEGTDLVNRSGDALREIVASMNNVARIISEIAAASQEQNQGVGQINIAISEMDTMTQQNAALVEETASASEEMASQAKDLLAMMERFKIRDYGVSSAAADGRREVKIKALAESGKKPADRPAEKADVSMERRRKFEVKKPAATGKEIAEVLKDEGFEEF